MLRDSFVKMPFSNMLFAKWQPYNVPVMGLISPTADTTEFMPAVSAV